MNTPPIEKDIMEYAVSFPKITAVKCISTFFFLAKMMFLLRSVPFSQSPDLGLNVLAALDRHLDGPAVADLHLLLQLLRHLRVLLLLLLLLLLLSPFGGAVPVVAPVVPPRPVSDKRRLLLLLLLLVHLRHLLQKRRLLLLLLLLLKVLLLLRQQGHPLLQHGHLPPGVPLVEVGHGGGRQRGRGREAVGDGLGGVNLPVDVAVRRDRPLLVGVLVQVVEGRANAWKREKRKLLNYERF